MLRCAQSNPIYWVAVAAPNMKRSDTGCSTAALRVDLWMVWCLSKNGNEDV